MASSTETETETGPACPTATAAHAKVVLTVASLGFFLITLDISIVNVALSRVRDELGGGPTGQQWVIDGYTLVFAALLLFAGNLSDRVGVKRALALGIAVFAVASAGCAAAPEHRAPDRRTVRPRCRCRGAAAGLDGAGSRGVPRPFPTCPRSGRLGGRRSRGRAGGSAPGRSAHHDRLALGVQHQPARLRRHAGFPVRGGAVDEPPGSFDWAGQILAVLAMTALVWGLIEGGHLGFTRAGELGALAVAVTAGIAFVWVQARARHPMMPLSLFRARGFRIALPIGFALMVGNYGNVFVVSLYLQQHLGLSPLVAGLTFLPSAFFAIAGNLLSGPATNRFGARVPVVVGLSLMVVGVVALLLTAPLPMPVVTALCAIPVGAGGALAMPSITGVVLEGVSSDLAGTASAVFNTFRQVAGAVAVAVFGALIANPDRFLPGMQLSLGIAAATLLLAASSSLRIQPRS